jgi:hypothetical protein
VLQRNPQGEFPVLPAVQTVIDPLPGRLVKHAADSEGTERRTRVAGMNVGRVHQNPVFRHHADVLRRLDIPREPAEVRPLHLKRGKRRRLMETAGEGGVRGQFGTVGASGTGDVQRSVARRRNAVVHDSVPMVVAACTSQSHSALRTFPA